MFTSPSVNLYVGDVEACARFYAEQFGFVETFRTPATGAPVHVELRMESFILGVASADSLREDHGVSALRSC